MKKVNSFFLILFLILVFFACSNNHEDKPLIINNYLDITTLNSEEISFIENLQYQDVTIKYGHMLSSQAYLNSKGEYTGFIIEACKLFTKIFEIKFEPVCFDNWNNLIESLNNHEIDIIDYYTNGFEFPLYETTPIGDRNLSISTLNNNNFNCVDDIMNKRIAFFEGMTTYKTITNYYKNLEFDVVYIKDVEDLVNKFTNDEIDAFVIEEVALPIFEGIIELDSKSFFPLIELPISILTTNDSLSPLIKCIDKYLKIGGIETLSNIKKNSLLLYNSNQFLKSLTKDEIDYIRNLNERNSLIEVGILSDAYPIAFYNDNSKCYEGISIDVLNEVSKITNINFHICYGNKLTLNELLKSLDRNEISLISYLVYSDKRSNDFIFNDNSYHDTKPALLSLSSTPYFDLYEVYYKKVGFVRSSAFNEMFDKLIPNHKFKYTYETTTDAFNALENKEVDLLMLSEDMLLSQTNFNEKTEFKINLSFEENIGSFFAFNKDEVVLKNIISKSLKYIDTNEISNRWTHLVFDYSSKTKQLHSTYIWIFITVILVVTTLLTTLFFANTKLRIRLSERTAVLSTTYDLVPDCIFTKDLNGKYTSCNKVFEEITGLSEKQIVGKDYQEIFKHTDPERIKASKLNEAKVIKDKIMYISEEEVIYPNKQVRIFELIKTSLIQDNKIVGLLGVGRDITNRKSIENQSREIAKSKSIFLANMSHEIRTPMNAIIGFSELALDANISLDAKDDYFRKIKVSGEWLLKIINDILDVSKFESGKIDLELIPFELFEVINKCQTIMLPKALEKGLTLFYDIEDLNGIKLIGDPLRLRQVLINLLANAVKFTEVGIIKLVATITKTTEDTVTIKFSVIDSGVGIPSDKIATLFDPFVQVDPSTTRKYGGTGLGLTISQSIIKFMGGVLEVESSVGIGSKFSFKLPFFKAPTNENLNTTKTIKKPKFSGDVLICEDNEINQIVLKDHLQRVGLNVEVSENGVICLDVVKNRIKNKIKPFDLIFMDVQMPLMDGIETTKALKEMNYIAPIIPTTANVLKEDIEKYRSCGMVDYLSKPYTTEELWSCLSKYLKASSLETINEDSDSQLLLKISKEFVNKNQDTLTNIKDAINKGKLKYAYRLIHTIRGDAILMERHQLSDISRIIESSLKENEVNFTKEDMKVFETELNIVLNELSYLLDANISETDKLLLIDKKKSLKDLNKLRKLLENDDTDCMNLIPIIQEIPTTNELIKYIEEYEFDTALEILNLLIQKIMEL